MSLDLATRQRIEARIRAAVPDVQDVLLFGSHARGDARRDSDVDLLVVVPESTGRRTCARTLQLALDGLGLAFDLVVVSPSEWRAMRASPGYLQRTITREARRLVDAA